MKTNEQIFQILAEAQQVSDARAKIVHQLRNEFFEILKRFVEKSASLKYKCLPVDYNDSLFGEKIQNDNWENIDTKRSIELYLNDGQLDAYSACDYGQRSNTWDFTYSDTKLDLNEIKKKLTLVGMLDVIEQAALKLEKRTAYQADLVEKASKTIGQ